MIIEEIKENGIIDTLSSLAVGAHAALEIHNKLTAPKPKRRRRRKNSSAAQMALRDETDEYFTDIYDLDEVSEMFQGKLIDKETELQASKFTPKNVSRLGNLEYIILEDGTKFNFNPDECFAVMDRRKNIHFVGNVQFDADSFVNHDILNILGKVQRFQYITDKAHIEDNKTVHYFHDFGEVDKTLPYLAIDDEGFPVLVGGNYAVKTEGVIN